MLEKGGGPLKHQTGFLLCLLLSSSVSTMGFYCLELWIVEKPSSDVFLLGSLGWLLKGYEMLILSKEEKAIRAVIVQSFMHCFESTGNSLRSCWTTSYLLLSDKGPFVRLQGTMVTYRHFVITSWGHPWAIRRTPPPPLSNSLDAANSWVKWSGSESSMIPAGNETGTAHVPALSMCINSSQERPTTWYYATGQEGFVRFIYMLRNTKSLVSTKPAGEHVVINLLLGVYSNQKGTVQRDSI